MRTTTNLLALISLPVCIACSGSGGQTIAGQGGTQGAGGSAAPGSGGVSTTFSKGGATTTLGGASATGGTSASTARSTRGATTIGGAPEAGGAPAIDGTTSAGNQEGTGGTASTGGIPATGGASAGGKATGGTATSGGSTATGGTATKGGTATGGSSGTGGAPLACVTNQISVCSGTNPINCDFGGDVGDYEVTVDLGGSAAGDMYVEAESYRRMLGEVKTAAGETKRFSFGVNVRSPEGEPLSTTTGTPGLQVYIRGTTPKLSAICAKALSPVPKVWVAGDSTVCDQGGTDYAGWGQHLPQFFTVPVSVANYADSGESSTTVLNSSKMWGAIKAAWKAGDWVFVQVGHNDKNAGDDGGATFKSNMTAFATQAKAANVNIVLCTPTSRVGYTLAEEHVWGTANLPQIIRDVGKAQGVPVIDLTVTTWNWLQTIDWKQYFALGSDKTHTNPAGADVIAEFVRDAAKDQKLGLATYIRP